MQGNGPHVSSYVSPARYAEARAVPRFALRLEHFPPEKKRRLSPLEGAGTLSLLPYAPLIPFHMEKEVAFFAAEEGFARLKLRQAFVVGETYLSKGENATGDMLSLLWEKGANL